MALPVSQQRRDAIRAAMKLHKWCRTTCLSTTDIRAMGFERPDVDAAYLFEKMGEILAQAFCDGLTPQDVTQQGEADV